MMTDFAAFILTHGRPDRVVTYATMRKAGYTGRIFLVVDDEDKALPEYQKRYGAEVLTFNKRDALRLVDDGINDDDMRSPVYARNACFELAKGLGIEWFVQLDDDYVSFALRFDADLHTMRGSKPIKNMDVVISALVDFAVESKIDCVAISQGGDWIGGAAGVPSPRLRRKVMNFFVLHVDSHFRFMAKLNDDVTSYIVHGMRGQLLLTVMQAVLDQGQTQANPGGLTEIYLEGGTYVKSFYSVMFAPGCVKIGAMGDNSTSVSRFHHEIDWNATAPKILHESWRLK